MDKLPTIYQILESAEGENFGEEITAINDYLKKEYPDHDEFIWSGSKLTITFKNDKDDVVFTRDQLTDKIPKLNN